MLISMFRDFNKVEANLDISVILRQIRSGKYKAKITALRELLRQGKTDDYNTSKRSLPAFTPSGLFENGRKIENLKEYSGLIVLDLDKLSLEQLSLAVNKAQEIQYTYASFISPSGQGLKVLVKVFSRPVFHKSIFNQVKGFYETRLNLVIDPSGKDITRLCFVSWDESLYLNPSSLIFKPTINMIEEDIEKIVNQIESRRLDITSRYETWIKIAFSLIDAIGEEGRSYFHRLSKFYQGYTQKECDEQFDRCLNSKNSGITSRTFFFIARDQGLNISSCTSFNGQEIAAPRNKITPENIIPETDLTINPDPLPEESEKDKVSQAPLPKWVEIEKFLSSRFEFRNNIVAHVIEYRDKSGTEFKEINENSLHRFLQISGVKFSLTHLKSLLQSDFIPEFDPFLDYFQSLPVWDGHTDYITGLAVYIKANDQPAFNYHFMKMMVRCVACALKEYYYNKQAFIIVGYRQNTGKSTWIRFLCPPKLNRYIYENISTDKDALMCLSENLIINLDELAIFDKKEINYLKSLLSKDRVKIRRPFATRATSDARRASFFGSTNNNVFLTDETGSVRWLCFEIDSIDFSYTNKVNIDLVWSQAYYLFLHGFNYELTPDEIRENEKRNEQFQHLSLEYELIQKTYVPGDASSHLAFYTASDVLQNINERYSVRSRLTPEKIGKAMVKLGFQKVPRRKEGQQNPVYGYFVKFID